MGNRKNRKYHRNQHRFTFHRRRPRKGSEAQESIPVENREPTVEVNGSSVEIDGSRIVNISQLEKYITELSRHIACCNSTGNVMLTAEKRDGLASIISTQCSTCGYKVDLETSRKVSGRTGYSRWEVNLAAVWGQMSTGGGHSTLTESMSFLGVPVMSQKNFMTTERTIGEWWREIFHQSMIEAGKQEKEMAVECGDYHDGVPAITVIVDGGWSKRSHRHSYNAKSGVGIIIGLKTKKIIHMSVKNKYCARCAAGSPRDKHHCYKNWDESSSAMETQAILEGFQQSERIHGLRYTSFIGDGDSSVYPTLLQEVPNYGRAIKKLECANHACKCYRSSLEQLVQMNPSYKGKGGLTLQMRKKLTSAARCAIKMRSREDDRRKGVKLLEKDLRNGPYHCFGIHNGCSTDFCTHVNELTSSVAESDNDEVIDEELEEVEGKYKTKEVL